MKIRITVVMLAALTVAACAGLGTPKGDRSLERNGEAFVQLQELKSQLQAQGKMNPELMSKTQQQLQEQESWLGLGDYYYLEGTQYFLSMAAGGTDQANYEKAQHSLSLSAQYYQDLDEEWLEAQSIWMLALTNMRAGKPEETCGYYHKTLKLLKKPSGQLSEFNYERDKFQAPQEYVQGVMGEACAIYQAQQAVAKNSQ
ncbi:hypothetical protein [Ketobacter sp.]|uniref:hypothetical protein n=1 Tax=Ketobacter sp. TaxID=2083498 RepID=UPI000F219456|nr:hypothetical protein [Ketobacter sp.]RLU01147.1 MAG: hypothetical protein D9N14_04175 [Ketobacter sp.]